MFDSRFNSEPLTNEPRIRCANYVIKAGSTNIFKEYFIELLDYFAFIAIDNRSNTGQQAATALVVVSL